MQFLNSIWLFAITAISIPVIIHLWNIKPGKTLKVGSIALITEAAQKSSRSFKLNDVLLFLVRCILLIVVALLLAVPIYRKYQSLSTVKGWVIIPKESLKETYNKFKPVIDSLSKSGYEFHFFEGKFSKFDLNKALNDTAKDRRAEVKNYWNLLSILNKQLPETMPVYLFTPNQSRYFSGSKPSVSLNLHWQTYTPADSVTQWIKSAWFTNSNAIKVVEGNSKPSGTYFTNYIIKSEGDPKSPFTVDVNQGKLAINLKNTKQKSTLIDTTALKIAIYTDVYKADAGYLKAALLAVGNFALRKISIQQYADPSQIKAGNSWIFWLSDKPIDAATVKKTGQIFSYEPGKIANKSSWIKTGGAYTISRQEQPAALYKLISTDLNKVPNPIWVDGFGNPVLIQEAHSYHFYSHFNPTWNDLVWSDNFPKLLLNLILYSTDSKEDILKNRTVIDHQQLMPNIISSSHRADYKLVEETDLSRYCWLLSAIIFFVERWLAHKNKPVLKHD
ncbi:BatA domain-containing protein [Mucilaginibacter flavus]|uniref:BatA domain-containing protein n=1 Tax=Mucilaginibacter flavus TaxID=931504 RepID=UPI0025B61B48|nr:BatA domain-containing protein [Mucilaginibacter flavus]MDN3584820.1 BatA domain-containing protein [Mucilaginibacter flavus]